MVYSVGSHWAYNVISGFFTGVVQDKFSAIRIGYAATVLLGIPPYEIPVRSIKAHFNSSVS